MNDNIDLIPEPDNTEKQKALRVIFDALGITDKNIDQYFKIEDIGGSHPTLYLSIHPRKALLAAFEGVSLSPSQRYLSIIVRKKVKIYDSRQHLLKFKIGGTSISTMGDSVRSRLLRTVDGLIDIYSTTSRALDPVSPETLRELADSLVQQDAHTAIQEMILAKQFSMNLDINIRIGNYLMKYIREFRPLEAEESERVSNTLAVSMFASLYTGESRLTLIPQLGLYPFVEITRDTPLAYFSTRQFYFPNLPTWFDAYRKSIELICKLEVDKTYQEDIKSEILGLLVEYRDEVSRAINTSFKYYLLTQIKPRKGVKILSGDHEYMSETQLLNILMEQSPESYREAIKLKTVVQEYYEHVFTMMKRTVTSNRRYEIPDIDEYIGPNATRDVDRSNESRRITGALKDQETMRRYIEEGYINDDEA